MSNVQCLVKIADNLLHSSPAPTVTNPDTASYMEVSAPLSDVASYETRNYRWNVKESKFYDAGLKDVSGIDPAKVVMQPFADTANYFFRGQGFEFEIPSSSTFAYDVQVPNERVIDGASIWHTGGSHSCYINFKIVDKDGLYSPANTVLNQFGYDWRIHPTATNSIKPGYPATIYPGLYVRLEFTNPTGSAVTAHGNLLLHEKKVDV